MTAANGFNSETSAAVLRRCTANVVSAFVLLARPARIQSQAPWLLPRRQLIMASAVFAAMFLFGLIFIDAAAINAARRLPAWINSLFSWITDFGESGWFLWPLGILFLILAALPQSVTRVSQRVLASVMVRVGFLFTAIAVPGLFTTIVKHIIGRARPFVTGIADPYVFAPFSWSAAYASLPSGHATTAFSVLAAFGTLWSRGRAIVLIYALLILVSRIVVTAHRPTDVLTGAVVGFAGALMVRHWFALRRLGFSIGVGGKLHQYSGPSLKRIKSVARELLEQ
jgi:membrane-associated phospholipid phosphatase